MLSDRSGQDPREWAGSELQAKRQRWIQESLREAKVPSHWAAPGALVMAPRWLSGEHLSTCCMLLLESIGFLPVKTFDSAQQQGLSRPRNGALDIEHLGRWTDGRVPRMWWKSFCQYRTRRQRSRRVHASATVTVVAFHVDKK